ncbi:sensor histidine kinase [Terrabacter sp. MAHUQ-38]|uniref:sensor histidine kinase n=1 Tax=unclassified Terrabacter TaxID=2630222 RepID=UPI00165E2386|nr:ATP-binding protein [Terrabacter sp. MAHUQ-38]MBC9823316.1 cyclic nucleotide-binding domain-containing protein [Terrabacter sp. MAHUQ-38]
MLDLADLRKVPLFDGLRDDQLAVLLADGAEQPVIPGEVVFREGDHADDWWVLVDGALDLSRHIGREDVVVGRMDVPGRWAGGFRAWDEQGVYLATARGVTAGRLLRVSSERLHELANEWFPFAAHLVAGLYGTARSIEATARQRNGLVTLGTLAAGLAHEINNPAAAATRSAAELERACDGLLDSLRHMAVSEVTAAQFNELDALRRELKPPTALADPLETADREEVLGDWLERSGVDKPWDLAPALVSAGADVAWLERAAAATAPDALDASLGWVARTIDVSALLAEVRESTRRVSELVAGIKTYSQMDRASHQRLDVREGLESTLLVMGPRLREGVTVVRDWGTDVPLVDGLPGELNQVWTNLVDNAVDAMEGSGTLTVRTRRDGDAVLVEVRDTGVGLSPEAQQRAFEAFYTTKDVGRGTGLGLDIAQRIVVDRHGGTIEVESRPGDTRFRVRLPITSPTPTGP